MNLKIDYIDPGSLIPYVNNSREHSDEQILKICSSIQEFGFTNPVLIDENNGLIAGHCRVLASIKLDLDTIPCIKLEGLTEAQKKAYVIADNKLALDSTWNQEMLVNELKGIQELDYQIENTGFSSDELDELLNNLNVLEPEETQGDDDVPEHVESLTVKGDLYELGPHRLLCGDATNLQNVEILMGEEKADLIVTDPPYNVDYEGKTKQKLKIKNDSMGDSTFYQFLSDTFTHYFAFTKDGGALYVFHADFEGLNFRRAFVESGFDLKQCCIWIKDVMVMGRQDYHWQHEPVLYGWKPGAPHFWNSDRKQTTFWSFDRPKQSKEHPTMKPIDLVCYPIMNSSQKGQIVMDLFGGSGSTLIASEKTGRLCRTMELDPGYCDVIVKRYVDFCKKNNRKYSVKRNGEECNDFN